jgi:hypothetical protein
MSCRVLLLAFGIVCWPHSLHAQQANAQATYTLKPTPKTVAWGYYDAKTAPVLRVRPAGEGKALHPFGGFDFLLAAPKKEEN